MTAPNVNALWGRVVLDELAKAGVDAVCVAPGSRSTPLVVAAAEHHAVEVFSHLDERSAGFFALGRAKRSGRPTPLVCTSGTAAAEFHPAVVEADRSRTPMVVLTADRPPELADSGANQTIDQHRLYGGAVRWFRSLAEPAPDGRKLRSLRTTVARAVVESTGPDPGPVHLNVPFRKPLAPVEDYGSVPDDLAERAPLAVRGRDGPYVRPHAGAPTLADAELATVADAVAGAERGLVVAGPADVGGLDPEALVALVDATGFPVLADPLSGLRFGPHVERLPVHGAYDAYLETAASERWPDPDVVLRFGASPTSKPLREYLASSGARQFLVDPAADWREATFTASDLVVAEPSGFARAVAARVEERRAGDGRAVGPDADQWASRFEAAESVHRELVAGTDDLFEGGVAAVVAERAPDPATVAVASSMPVRDLDRFAAPSTAERTVLGTRGASGIDGVTSAALGAGSATADPLVLLAGDLAFYHDSNGLLAVERCGVEATMVVVNNDGGGIFHRLPIAGFDPPFTEQFVTPHGLDFAHLADLYGLTHVTVDSLDGLAEAYDEAIDAPGSHLVEVRTDAAASHAVRDRLQAELVDRLT